MMRVIRDLYMDYSRQVLRISRCDAAVKSKNNMVDQEHGFETFGYLENIAEEEGPKSTIQNPPFPSR